MKILLWLPFLLAGWSCRVAQKGDKEIIMASLERTPCFGTCKAYRVAIYPDGQAVYEGKEHVARMGQHKAKLSKKELKELTALFEQYRIFNFKDTYESAMSDLPTTYLHYSHGGQTKDITDYDRAPRELRELEKAFDQLIESYEWKK